MSANAPGSIDEYLKQLRTALAPQSVLAALVCMALGVMILALILHAARWIARGHARLAKALLVTS